jgi:hypothetical protein
MRSSMTCATATVLLLIFLSSAQETGLLGTVTDSQGKPLAGVHVQGSPGKCCPSDSESTESNSFGKFQLKRPGQVIHLWKEDFDLQSRIVKPGLTEIQIVLDQANNSLKLSTCQKLRQGFKQIGGRVRFAVPKSGFQILGGKRDVDYVRYVIKPSEGNSFLELWFGPYAISLEPSDEQFLDSADFAQRYVTLPGVGVAGEDSYGHLSEVGNWRHMAIATVGGAIYDKASVKEAALYDQIINTACYIPPDPSH